MSLNSVFQLSVLSQNDQPNTSCDGCKYGAEIWAMVIGYGGGEFLTGPPKANYPTSNEKIGQWVLLPIPNSGKATPTWYFEVTDGIEEAWIDLEIYTPNYGIRTICVQGSSMPSWVAQNKKRDTNQIYQKGNCGIFGYAQENTNSDPIFWVYTVTAGVCDPKIHPNG